MPNRLHIATFIFFSIFLFSGLAEAADAKIKICLEQVATLNIKKDIVLENGGLWSSFSQSQKVRSHSSAGLQLDSKLNQIISVLNYLCETINGVPFNDLAIYLVENLQHKSKKDFRAELIILGKNHGVIDVWMKFHDISLKNQHRSLELDEINKAIQKAFPLVDKYVNIQKMLDKSSKESIILTSGALQKEIDIFLASDPMMSQAILEDTQVPYWDINESSGGS